MFVNCPHCGGLVATDPATDLPPPRCPRCAAALRDTAAGDPPAAAVAIAASVVPPQPLQPTPIAVTLRIDTAATATGDDDTATPPVAPVTARIELDADVAAVPDADAPAAGSVELAAAVDDAITTTAPGAPVIAPPPPAGTTTAPKFARDRGGATAARTGWKLPAATLALLALLALQWLLADRARLAQDAGWRPLVLRACALLRCDVPPWHQPSAFTVIERDVRPHPSRPGVLRVSATFRNDAAWAQAWPLLQLTLSDVDGGAEATRAFTVAEYLPAAPAQSGIGSGQIASVAMDVVEPSPRVVAFAFDFH